MAVSIRSPHSRDLTICVLLPQGGGGGSTLIVSYIRRLGLFFFFVSNFKLLNFNILGVLRKINVFWGMKVWWIFFLESPQNWTIFRVISMHFRVFS